MMTTNLFVIANVKQLRTQVVLEFYCLFFRTAWSIGVVNSAIFNSFHNQVEFSTILEGLRNFGEGGGCLNHPSRYATAALYYKIQRWKSTCEDWDVLFTKLTHFHTLPWNEVYYGYIVYRSLPTYSQISVCMWHTHTQNKVSDYWWHKLHSGKARQMLAIWWFSQLSRQMVPAAPQQEGCC